MIELYEGVPGSGKSYHAVQDFLLHHVRANRRLYVHIDGFHLDRLAAFEGRPVEELKKQITLWQTEQDVMCNLLTVEPGSAIFIDEAQTIFRAQTKVPPELLRWLETHRHYGVDILMACQSHGQMTGGVLRLVEVTTAFRKLSRVGLGNRYQGKIRGNPEETEVIRSFTGKYDPKVYAYYSSYRSATVKENSREYSIFRSVFVTGGLALGVIAIFLLLKLKDNPLSNSVGDAHASTIDVKKLPPPPSKVPPMPAEFGGSVTEGETPKPIYVEGSFCDGTSCRYIARGKFLSLSQLSALSGAPVSEYAEKGITYPYGERIVWGGPVPTKEELQDTIEIIEAHQKLLSLMIGGPVEKKEDKPMKDHSGKVETMGTEPPRPAYLDNDTVMESYADSGNH